MSLWQHFKSLVKKSFHGTLRFLEIGEALAATVVYTLSFFLPTWEKELKVLFVVVAGATLLTFIWGLILASYWIVQEKEDSAKECQLQFNAQLGESKARQEADAEKAQALFNEQLEKLKVELEQANDLIETLKEKKQNDEHRAQIKNGLTKFLKEGDALNRKDMGGRGIEEWKELVKAWSHWVYDYIQKNISKNDAVLFGSADISGISFDEALSEDRDTVLRFLQLFLNNLRALIASC